MERAAPDYDAGYRHVAHARERDIGLLIEWLVEQPVGRLTVVAPTFDALGDSPATAALITAGAIGVSAKARLHGRIGVDARVLVLWPDLNTLDRLERMEPTAMAVAPKGLDGIHIWLAARRPLDVESHRRADGPTISPIVQAALESLIVWADPRHALGTFNRRYMVDVFSALHREGHQWTGDGVAGYMAEHGWSLITAAQVGRLSQVVLNADDPFTGRPDLDRSVVAQWENRASELMG